MCEEDVVGAEPAQFDLKPTTFASSSSSRVPFNQARDGSPTLWQFALFLAESWLH
jgi:hypothetical protein